VLEWWNPLLLYKQGAKKSEDTILEIPLSEILGKMGEKVDRKKGRSKKY